MENISIKNGLKTSATLPIDSSIIDLLKLDPHNMDKLVIYMSFLAIKIPSDRYNLII